MRGAIAVLTLLLLGGPVFAQSVLVLDDLPPGEHYIKVTVTSSGTTAKVVTALRIGDAPPKPTRPPAPKSPLAKQVAELVKAVPPHKGKDDVRQALAATYLALSQKWDAGEIDSLPKLMEARGSAHSLWVSQLGGGDHWKEFDAEVLKLLNENAGRQSQIATALADVSAGLSDGEFLSPELIGLAIEVIDTLINRPDDDGDGKPDPVSLSELLPIVLKALKIFIARRG